MPRFTYPQTVTKVKLATEAIREAKDSIDDHEPVAGHNRSIMQEASADIHWALIMLDRALSSLKKWKKVGPNGSPSVEERIRRSRSGSPGIQEETKPEVDAKRSE